MTTDNHHPDDAHPNPTAEDRSAPWIGLAPMEENAARAVVDRALAAFDNGLPFVVRDIRHVLTMTGHRLSWLLGVLRERVEEGVLTKDPWTEGGAYRLAKTPIWWDQEVIFVDTSILPPEMLADPDDGQGDEGQDVDVASLPAAAGHGRRRLDTLPTADLVRTLRTSAELSGLAVIANPGLGDNAVAVDAEACRRTPVIHVGADLLEDDRSTVVAGTLAHEIAHHVLGHDKPGLPDYAQLLSEAAAVGAIATGVGYLAGAMSWWPAVALWLLAIAAKLTRHRLQRLAEFDADWMGAWLLDRAGLSGRRVMTAMLIDLLDLDKPEPSAWQRRFGRLLSSHPTAGARIAVLRSGMPPARLDWGSAMRCTATGRRLFTPAHRAVHGPGERCRPSWWRLTPLWRPPIWEH